MRRLQKLEEQRALLGFSADPSIDLEIEQIQQSLRTLDAEDAASASHAAENQVGATSQPSDRRDGSPHINANFHGKVDNVHIGCGDINVYGNQQPREMVPEHLLGLLRRGVREYAPANLADAALIHVNILENAIRRHDADDAEDALSWLRRRVPALDDQIQELRQRLNERSASRITHDE